MEWYGSVVRIPRYWGTAEETAQIRGLPFRVRAWGWSDQSVEEAAAMARERPPAIRQAIEERKSSRTYGYFANPIREVRGYA